MIHRSEERTNRRAPVHSPGVLVLTAHLALPATAFGTGLAEWGGRLAAQTVVESEAPRNPDLVLADEPLVRIGMVDGPEEYLFGNVTGAVRLEDGSIVVADEQSYAVRRYDATGRHMWTGGRQGEGPGEYGGLRLLRGCPGAAITVFDWHLDRVTQLDVDGNVVNTRPLNAIGVNPYGDPACSPDGDLIFAPWPESHPRVAPGEHHRWRMTLIRARGDTRDTLRSGIPGAERTRLETGERPRIWGRTMVFAVAPTGVWYGCRLRDRGGRTGRHPRRALGRPGSQGPVMDLTATPGWPAVREGKLAGDTGRTARPTALRARTAACGSRPRTPDLLGPDGTWIQDSQPAPPSSTRAGTGCCCAGARGRAHRGGLSFGGERRILIARAE